MSECLLPQISIFNVKGEDIFPKMRMYNRVSSKLLLRLMQSSRKLDLQGAFALSTSVSVEFGLLVPSKFLLLHRTSESTSSALPEFSEFSY